MGKVNKMFKVSVKTSNWGSLEGGVDASECVASYKR
jgi:hypothetical protein